MFASLTVLPAVLAWLGDRVEKGRIPFSGACAGPGASRGSGRRSSRRVMRRPVARDRRSPAALLVALAIPALSMNIVQTGADDLPQDLPVMQDLQPDQGRVPARRSTRRRRRQGRRRAQRPGRRRRSTSWSRGRGVRYAPRRHRRHLQQGRHGRADRDSRPRQRHRRRSPRPRWTRSATRSSRPRSARSTAPTANVTGDAAQSEDFSDLLSERLPLVFAFVLRARVPAAAVHVPLDRDPDQGDRAQPALGRRGLRRAGARLPGRARASRCSASSRTAASPTGCRCSCS